MWVLKYLIKIQHSARCAVGFWFYDCFCSYKKQVAAQNRAEVQEIEKCQLDRERYMRPWFRTPTLESTDEEHRAIYSAAL